MNGELSFKINKEKLILLFLLSISVVNLITLILATIIACLYLLATNSIPRGSVKALLFITIRAQFNSGIAVGYDSVSLLKWSFVLGLSLLCLLFSHYKNSSNNAFLISLTTFFAYVVIISFFNSGYPIISVFKAFSWYFVFVSVIIAVDNEDFNWLSYLSWFLNIIVLLSPFVSLTGMAFLRNGHAFQGLVNHPNMLGILTAIAFAINIYLVQTNTGIINKLVLPLCLIECILSESRTGVLCIAISIIIFFLYNINGGWKKTIAIAITVIGLILVFSFGFESSIQDFFYKGQSANNWLYSREGQIQNGFLKFERNPIIGSGFMVPINKYGKDYSLSFDLEVEPGNILLSLLGDVGILGLVLFFVCYLCLFVYMNKKKAILFFAPFLASMGEMIFFSTNSIAIVYYLIFAYCYTNSNTIASKKDIYD